MQKHFHIPDKIGFTLPMIAGCFVVLSVFSGNAYRLEWSQLPTGLAIGAVVGLLSWVVFYAMPFTRPSSAVISSVVTMALMTWAVYPFPIIPTMVMLSTIIVFYDIKPHHKRIITNIAFIILVLAVPVALAQSVYTKILYAGNEGELQGQTVLLKHRPDIYFIVPDRFTSLSALDEIGYETSGFAGELEARGFYIRYNALSKDEATPTGDSLAPTSRTLRFMASVLNMGEDVDLCIPYNIASNRVKQHLVGKILKDNGYTYHHIGDWWQETLTNPNADRNYIYRGYSLIDYFAGDEFAVAIIDMSWLREANTGSLLSFKKLTEFNQARNLFQLAAFKDIAGSGEHPKFVFVHILIPHPPYVWGADTEGMSTKEKYLAQVQFTEGYLIQMIDAIEETDSIIIIQSDEGVNIGQFSNNKWNGVLTAWRIPGESFSEMDSVPIIDVLKFAINSIAGSEDIGEITSQ